MSVVPWVLSCWTVRTVMGGDVQRSAVLSNDGLYRYELTRMWDNEKRAAVWIMLNPSTADDDADDPTILRCISFSKAWGYGGIRVVNLYALRSTDPAALKRHPDPVGPLNDWHIKLAAGYSSRPVIAAWGTKAEASRAAAVADLIGPRLMCLVKTKHGHPKHPLYVKGDTQPVPWTRAEKQGMAS